MHKRKLFGLLPYGNRRYKKIKFQVGGSFTAVSKGYDWRDDPYEQQLAAEKLQRESAKYRGKGKPNGNSTTLKNTDFGVIDGGLIGATRAANAEFQKKINNYRQQIIAMGETGIEWANSPPGIQAFQDIKSWGQRVKLELIADKEAFDSASGKLKTQDKEALAMGNGAIFVETKEGAVGSVSIDTYLSDDYIGNENVYTMKVSRWETWKKNTDTSMDQNATQTVLVDGAVSESSIYEEYLKGIDFGLNKTSRMVSMDDGTRLDINDIRNGIASMVFTDTFYPNGIQLEKIKSNSKELNKFISSIMLKVRGEYGGANRIMSSLQSAVLKNSYHKQKMRDMKTVAERKKYLNTQAELLLVNRVLLGEKSDISSSPTGSTKGNIGDSTSSIGAEITSNILTGDKSKKYVFGSRVGDDQVVDYAAPGISNVMSKEELNLSEHSEATDKEKKENLLFSNKNLNKVSNMKDIYTASGAKVTDIMPEAGLIDNELLINPYENIDLVFLPTADGRPMMQEMSELYDVKIASRKRFLDFYNNLHQNDPFKVKPRDLTSTSSHAEAENAYAKYVEWVTLGTEHWEESISKDLKRKNLSQEAKIVLKERLEFSRNSQKAKEEFKTQITTVLGNTPVIIKPFLAIPVLANNDGGWWTDNDIAKKIDEVLAEAVNANADDKSRPANSSQKTSGAENKYINYMDKDKFNWNPFSDDNEKFSLYAPVDNEYLISKREGFKEEEAQKSAKIGDFILRFVNSKGTNQRMSMEALDLLLLN